VETELGNEPVEAELRLLALSSQFFGVAVTMDAPARLRTLPDVPALALPTVPETSRPLVRRVLTTAKEKRLRTELLEFLAARGWTVHPGDWLPTTNDEEAPDVYAPWLDWANIAASATVARQKVSGGLTGKLGTITGRRRGRLRCRSSGSANPMQRGGCWRQSSPAKARRRG
jgi:hypothetical protein